MQNLPLFRLLAYLKPYRRHYLLGILYSFLNKLFDIAPEILIGVAIDVVVHQKHSWLAQIGITGIQEQLILLGVLTFIIWVGESLFQYLYSLKWRNLAQVIQHALRLETFAHAQKLDQKTFDELRTGNLMSILNDDINQLERFLEDGINQILQICISTIVVGLIFFLLAPKLALLAITPVPFIIIGAFYFQHRLAPRFLEVREKAGSISSRLTNTLLGVVTIKSLTAEQHELEKIHQASADYREANRRAIRLSSLVTPVIRIVILIGFLSTLVYGGLLTIDGTLNVGIYGMLVFLTQRLLWPLTLLADVTINYQRTMAATTRVLDLLNTPISIIHKGLPLAKERVRGEIAFDRISFAYDPQKRILHDFSVHLPAGKTVAFVGTTGSGKTTLAKLLLRLYEPQEGKILIDGKAINTLEIGDLRRAVGLVSQEIFLFHGTVAENIAYPDTTIPHEKIVEAAMQAEAHEFISNLPRGYETIIGERGQKLSGGQKQRLAIARALIKNPPILFLDEATSAVDNETEMAIQNSLARITQGRTVVLVAHRLSTVRHADHIHVMQHGAIVESGTHDHLLAHGKIYASLWALQTGQR